MPIFAIQYLEDSPEIAGITPQAARSRLQDALDRLPITLVLLGWHLPAALLSACAEVCQRGGARLYRWHPLLTGDGTLMPRPEWQVIGLYGDPVPGFQGKPEFTFVCPNRPAVRDAVLSHLRDVLHDGRYQGVFLDRIRYPSPAAGPGALGCFCEDCHRAADQEGFDLDAARHRISQMITTRKGAQEFVCILLDPSGAAASDPDHQALAAFLDFRARSVTRLICEAAELIHGMGCAVGLDAFTPVLAHMVGQDLGTLDECADWIKIMSYGHAFGPAGMPFELLGLANGLFETHRLPESDVLAWLAGATGLSLPMDRNGLRTRGLPPDALQGQVLRARESGVTTLLAGVELVEMPDVSELNHAQIRADLTAFRTAGADGLVLSWDLWAMPLERLDLVREVWTSPVI